MTVMKGLLQPDEKAPFLDILHDISLTKRPEVMKEILHTGNRDL